MNTPQSPRSKNKLKIFYIITFIFLIGLLLSSLGYNLWLHQQRSDLEATLSKQQTTKDTQNESTQPAQQRETPTVTETLPNNRIAMFPDTAGNRNILWWSANGTSVDAKYILLSHRSYQEFLSAVDESLVVQICGTDTNLKALKYNITAGIFNTDEKILQHPRNSSCIDLLASDENPDQAIRTRAQEVLITISQDIEAFINSVVISAR